MSKLKEKIIVAVANKMSEVKFIAFNAQNANIDYYKGFYDGMLWVLDLVCGK